MKLVTKFIALMALVTLGGLILAEDQMPKKTLLVMADLVTSQQLQQYILTHENAVVFFHGEHCPPCMAFEHKFTAVANSNEFAGVVSFIKVSATQYPSARKIYGVTKWPTVIYFKNGREMRRDVRRDDLSFISEETFRLHVRDLVNAS